MVLSDILTFVLVLYCMFCQEEMLFYSSMKKYCKKNNGECFKCSCWSCPRKLYKDEYYELKKVK